jgi:hypothetical protein
MVLPTVHIRRSVRRCPNEHNECSSVVVVVIGRGDDDASITTTILLALAK